MQRDFSRIQHLSWYHIISATKVGSYFFSIIIKKLPSGNQRWQWNIHDRSIFQGFFHEKISRIYIVTRVTRGEISLRSTLVGGWATPLKKMSSSIGMIIPNINGKMPKNGNQTTNQYISGFSTGDLQNLCSTHLQAISQRHKSAAWIHKSRREALWIDGKKGPIIAGPHKYPQIPWMSPNLFFFLFSIVSRCSRPKNSVANQVFAQHVAGRQDPAEFKPRQWSGSAMHANPLMFSRFDKSRANRKKKQSTW